MIIRDESALLESGMRMLDDYQYYQAALLYDSSDAVIALDPNFIITGWGHGAERLYEWSADEAIGQQARNIIQLDSLLFANFLENRPWRDDRAVYVKCMTVRRDGAEILVGVLLMSLSESDGYVAVIWKAANNGIDTPGESYADLLRFSLLDPNHGGSNIPDRWISLQDVLGTGARSRDEQGYFSW